MVKIAIIALTIGCAYADKCGVQPGGIVMTPQTSLENKFCTSDIASTESCRSACCKNKGGLCGAYTKIACEAGKFKDPAKYSTFAGKCTGLSNCNAVAKKTCCSVKATCATVKDADCPAGFKKKSNVATTQCDRNPCVTTAANLRDTGKCCEVDNTKCYAHRKTGCDAGKMEDSSQAGTAATAAEYKAKCCMAKGTCTNFKCPAGKKLKTSPGTRYCNKKACETDKDAGICCEDDKTKCGGVRVTVTDCGGDGNFVDLSKADALVNGDKKANCCGVKAKCDQSACSVGWKLKDTFTKGKDKCRGATCNPTADSSTCCIRDQAKCVSVPSSKCTGGTMKDVSKDGVDKGADLEAQRKNCCKARATCTSWISGSSSTGTTSTTSMARQTQTVVAQIVLAFAVALGLAK